MIIFNSYCKNIIGLIQLQYKPNKLTLSLAIKYLFIRLQQYILINKIQISHPTNYNKNVTFYILSNVNYHILNKLKYLITIASYCLYQHFYNNHKGQKPLILQSFLKNINIYIVIKNIIKKELIVIICLLVITYAAITNCFNSGKNSKDKIFAIMDQTEKKNIDQIIDDLSNFVKFLPKLLLDCGAQENSKKYNQELAVKCIDDRVEGFKIPFDLIKQSENQATFTFDLIIFEIFFNNKIKIIIPIFKDVTINQISNKAICIQCAKKKKNYLNDVQNDYLQAITIKQLMI